MAPDETSIPRLIHNWAADYEISSKELAGTLWCESRFKTDAVGHNGNPHGIAQIFLKYHPDVSLEEARNPTFPIRWTAEKFAQEDAHLWTCWRTLYAHAQQS